MSPGASREAPVDKRAHKDCNKTRAVSTDTNTNCMKTLFGVHAQVSYLFLFNFFWSTRHGSTGSGGSYAVRARGTCSRPELDGLDLGCVSPMAIAAVPRNCTGRAAAHVPSSMYGCNLLLEFHHASGVVVVVVSVVAPRRRAGRSCVVLLPA